MQSKEDRLLNQIALGWVMILLMEVIMLLFGTIDSILMDNNFYSLRMDPGQSLNWMVYLVAAKALMPIYVHSVHEMKWRALRWVAVAMAAATFVFYLLHHLSHWQYGQRPNFSSHVVDLLIEIIALWVIVGSVRWAKAARQDAA